ncbi:MAG: hypothetical protein GY714_08665 [Desulfobacterales bacterium]|nr:hypothetical protein [Desulfobacterales bacterium]
MLAEVEQKIIDVLKAGNTGIKSFNKKVGAQSGDYPAAFIEIDSAEYEVYGKSGVKCIPGISVTLIFKPDPIDEASGQKMLYLISMVTELLLMETFGLAITPVIPKSFETIIDESLESGLVKRQLNFTTSFTVIP